MNLRWIKPGISSYYCNAAIVDLEDFGAVEAETVLRQ